MGRKDISAATAHLYWIFPKHRKEKVGEHQKTTHLLVFTFLFSSLEGAQDKAVVDASDNRTLSSVCNNGFLGFSL